MVTRPRTNQNRIDMHMVGDHMYIYIYTYDICIKVVLLFFETSLYTISGGNLDSSWLMVHSICQSHFTCNGGRDCLRCNGWTCFTLILQLSSDQNSGNLMHICIYRG